MPATWSDTYAQLDSVQRRLRYTVGTFAVSASDYVLLTSAGSKECVEEVAEERHN